ncbi:hypothetical protein LTR50_006084 [Elasticomyces elasticus]|nr:hypothetical protein LTR50_006084 [Elasticomyces elasticus]
MFLIAQIAVYISLIKVTTQELDTPPTGATGTLLRNIVYRTSAISFVGVCARTYWNPPTEVAIFDVLLAGSSKAAYWLVLLYMTQRIPWDVATTVSTFAIASSTSSFGFISVLRALARSATAYAALIQTISFVPKSVRGRRLLFAFVLCPLFPLLRTSAASQGHHILTEKFGAMKQNQHPIELLIQRSSKEFTELLDRQSTTLDKAVAEYEKRYRRKPPPGFDKWFKYAQSQRSPIIDDFDSIMESLGPFWEVSPAQLRRTVEMALESPNAFYSFTIKDGSFGDEDNTVAKMLADVRQDLPEVTLILNALDEPRVILPTGRPDSALTDGIPFYDLTHRNAWSVITRPCGWQDSAPVQPARKPIASYGLSFVQSPRDAKDICRHPEYEKMHGMFSSPATLLYTDAFVPIFTSAKLSTFGDVLLPTPFYIEVQDGYKEEDDYPWEEKRNKLYWAGSTTGSHGRHGNWRMHHRQRFVIAANHLEPTTSTFLSEVRLGVWKAYKSREILSQLYHVQFTGLTQCEDGDCEAEKEYFHIGKWDEGSAGFKHRFIFDLDGNSYSGRFYNLLKSHSVIMKQTLFREWHDERLFPWVHYVPISLDLDELPETMRYLALTERGSKSAKDIAENGRGWRLNALRREDASIYMYRLILEYARLLDDARDSNNSIYMT